MFLSVTKIFSEQTMAVKYNSAIAKEYLSYLQQMAEEFQLENDIKSQHIVTLSGDSDDGRAGTG